MSKISICIPTYNREKYLKQLLDSIAKECDPNIFEICISDNGSTDGTKHLVEEFKKAFFNVVYFKFNSNQGADINYLNSVKIASSEFVWLMGSDDLIMKGCTEYILNDLDKINPAVALYNRNDCNLNMEFVRKRSWLGVENQKYTLEISGEEDLANYILECETLGGLFSYLSSIIVKRTEWDSIEFDKSYIGSLYSHAYILLEILMRGKNFYYSNQVIVNSRGGNDSFRKNWAQRALLDLDGYQKLSDSQNSQKIKLAIEELIFKEHNIKYITKLAAKMIFDIRNLRDYREYIVKVSRHPKKPRFFVLGIVVGILISPLYGAKLVKAKCF
jgi:abequosyltransferase